MIRFEKVSYEEYKSSMTDTFGDAFTEDFIKEVYNHIKLPQRGTHGSAGYDFYLPFSISMPGEMISVSADKEGVIKLTKDYLTIPTGIRFVTDRNDIVLLCVPRSGLGFKFGVRLKNTIGVIDSDYQYAKNSGHIMAKIGTESGVDLELGKAFMQGIIMPFLTVDEDNGEDLASRTGGFGSTDGN